MSEICAHCNGVGRGSELPCAPCGGTGRAQVLTSRTLAERADEMFAGWPYRPRKLVGMSEAEGVGGTDARD